MLSLQGVTKSHGAALVLDRVSLHVGAGDRVGIVGPNGSGKTTLLRIMAGRDAPDAGRVDRARGLRTGYLPQAPDSRTASTLAAAVLSAVPGLGEARAEVERSAADLAAGKLSAQGRLTRVYGLAVARFESLGGYEVEQRLPEVLAAVGLDGLEPEASTNWLSGGQWTRAGLAGLLLAQPDLLLLDEPTNHLDLDGLEWLEGFIGGFRGAVVVVSHDRVLLDSTVSRLLEIDARSHRAREFAGGYSDYRAVRDREAVKTRAAWADQQAETRRIRAGMRGAEQRARRTEGSTTHDFYRARAKKVARKVGAWRRKLERFEASEDRVSRPERTWELSLEFGPASRGGDRVIDLHRLGHHFGGEWLFRGVDLTLSHGERVALLGPNGVGKSTLLRVITGELHPAGGQARIGANVRLGYMAQGHEGLDPEASALTTIRTAAAMGETEARNFLHQFLFQGDEVFTLTGSLSPGERARLALATLVVSGANLLLLDEPVAHLDIPSRERFEEALLQFPGTVLIVAHDRALLDRVATGVWSMENGTIRRYPDRTEAARGVSAGRGRGPS